MIQLGLKVHFTAFPEAEFFGLIGEKSSKSFPPCYSQSALQTDFTTPLEQFGLKMACDVKIVYQDLNSENSQDHAQKLNTNCTFMNSASGAQCIVLTERYLCS